MANTLIVMLPGALMSPTEYATAGFADILAATWPEAELLPAAIDVNQLDVAVSIAALRELLTASALARGQHRLILGGISLGAAVALHYARHYPDDINGLCLLAPYPASRITTQAIRAAGGPAAWQPSEMQRNDAEFQLWDWLIRGHAGLPLYLGCGRDDRFADGQSLLAEALPAAIQHSVPGGHDWPVWQALWRDFVTRRDTFAPATAKGGA